MIFWYTVANTRKMFRFKVSFEADGTSRRFNLEQDDADESETLFDSLRAKILTMVPADQDISLYWLDASGGKILCDSEEELRIGLEECPTATTGIFELTVSPRPLRLPAPGSVSSGRILPAAIASSPATVRVIKVPPHRERRRCVCDECGRAFKCTSHLVDHKRTHSGEKPFKCEICGNTYRHRTSLKGHMNSHTGSKPHKCTFPSCTYESAWSSYMAEHMRQMHGTRNAESEEREVLKKNRPPKAKKGRKSKKNGSIEPGITLEDVPIDAEEEKEPVTRVLRRGRRKGKDIPTEPQAEKLKKTRKRKNAPKKVAGAAQNLNDGQSEVLLAVRYLTDNETNEDYPAVRVVGYYPTGVLPEDGTIPANEGNNETE